MGRNAAACDCFEHDRPRGQVLKKQSDLQLSSEPQHDKQSLQELLSLHSIVVGQTISGRAQLNRMQMSPLQPKRQTPTRTNPTRNNQRERPSHMSEFSTSEGITPGLRNHTPPRRRQTYRRANRGAINEYARGGRALRENVRDWKKGAGGQGGGEASGLARTARQLRDATYPRPWAVFTLGDFRRSSLPSAILARACNPPLPCITYWKSRCFSAF